jgi:hypothetical protein
MRKGQAAMEVLMTYGWAILVVLAAIGALAYFGVLDVNNILPERTVSQAPLPNIDNAVVSATGNVSVVLTNNVGSTINITNSATFTLSGEDDCSGLSSATATDLVVAYTNGSQITEPAQFSNGDTFLLQLACTGGTDGDRFKGDIKFSYMNMDSGLVRPHTISIRSKYT